MRRIFGNVAEQLDGLAAGHVEHVADRAAVVGDGERLGVVAPAAARVALDPHIGQEVHLDAELAVAFAAIAATARHVETEAARRITPHLGFRQLRKQHANQLEHAGVRGRIRRRRVAQRLLIHANHLVDELDAPQSRRAHRGSRWRDAAGGPAPGTARRQSANSCRCRSDR